VTSFFVSALVGFGVPAAAAAALGEVFHRPRGLIVISGPAGSGKSSLAEVACAELGRPVAFRGDLILPDALALAVEAAGRGLVVGVIKGGGEPAVRARLLAAGVSEAAIAAAGLAVVTLGLVAAVGLIVVEVRDADGRLLTGTLGEELAALVAAGAISPEQGRAALGEGGARA
jgi:hypothetical protein